MMITETECESKCKIMMIHSNLIGFDELNIAELEKDFFFKFRTLRQIHHQRKLMAKQTKKQTKKKIH